MACQYEFVRSDSYDNGTILYAHQSNFIESFNLDRRATSEQVPYQVVDIAHVALDPSNVNKKGRLMISISPGKKDSRSNRNLQLDIEAIRSSGIQIIICLLEWSEMRKLNIVDYPRKAQEAGFLFYHLPIKDRGVPQYKEITALVPAIVKHLADGENVLVHCKSGLGRAGTICACCLGHFGYSGTDAIEMVRKQRPGAIQTSKQEDCVLYYCSGLDSKNLRWIGRSPISSLD